MLQCKPEQVQAIRESERRGRREYLEYDAGDIISVLEKKYVTLDWSFFV